MRLEVGPRWRALSHAFVSVASQSKGTEWMSGVDGRFKFGELGGLVGDLNLEGAGEMAGEGRWLFEGERVGINCFRRSLALLFPAQGRWNFQQKSGVTSTQRD